MDSLKNKITKNKKDLKQSSIDSYINTVQKLSSYLGFKKFNIKYLKDHESVIDFIDTKSNFSLSTKRNYITPILVICDIYKFDKDIHKAYSDYHTKLSNVQNELYYDNVKNEKEYNNWISFDEIQDKIKVLKTNSKNNIWIFQQYVILCLYTLLPPIRNDYAGEMLLLKNEKENENEKCNKIVLSTSKLVLCNYKTSNTYGVKCIDIPKDLNNILTEWYNKREKELSFQPKFLLIKQSNPHEFVSKNLLTKILNKIFYPKKISTTILRKVYLSEKYPVINTYREMKNDAYIMGHDINTAKLIYSKQLN